jgi:kynurenine formamidase
VTDPPVEVLGRRVRLVDLSHPLGATPSEPVAPHVQRLDHEDGAGAWEALYGIPRDALPGGHGFAGETFDRLSTHAGTHVDAPWHYAPVAGDAPAPTIDEVPLGWCLGPLVVLDVSDLPAGHEVALADVDERLDRLGHPLRAGDVVALFTGAERAWGTEGFWELGCGLGREAVLGLVERGVRAIGTDAWSLDRPYPLIGAEWRERHDPAALWPAHFAGIERPYLQLEKLANLATIPAAGATIVAFPVKVERGSGAWTRAVALVPAY